MSTNPAAASIEPERDLKIPRHIGVIMDGNGRWAKQRGLSRSEGHRAGVEAVRRAVTLAMDYGVQCLTLFSFSAENWRRPPDEIRFIFGLLRRFVASDLEKLHQRNVRIRIIGERNGLERGLRGIIDDVEARTKDNTGLDLIIARKVAAGELSPEDIDETTLARHLDTSGLPDPDLILRTSGEMRLSNFLLWQSAYAELVFVPENWPDFDEAVFVRALRTYTGRDRRFGGIRT
jgi:undecaprenyl diphosphate synthase